MRGALVIGLLVGFAAIARAEDIAVYEVDGDADAGGPEPRVAALDAAFARAVSTALGDVLDSELRKANKAVIDREIVGRARLWVTKFTVTKDETNDGRRQLAVTVRVDRDKMRTRLGELTIGAQPAAPIPGTRSAVILLRVSDGTTTRAAYGHAATQSLPGLRALESVVRGAGMAIQRPPSTGPEARATGDLPLDDDEADAIAADAKADVAAIVGVTVGAPVVVRGVASPAVLVTAHLRLIERGKKLVGEGTASVAATPRAIDDAIGRAVVVAAADLLAAKPTIGQPQGFRGDDTPLADPDVVLVRLSPKTPYAIVTAELRYLAGAKGISRAVLRRVSPGGWVIGVTTRETIQRIANIAKQPPASDTFVQVKITGDIVDLALSGAP